MPSTLPRPPDLSSLSPTDQARYKALVEAVERDQIRERCKGRGGLLEFMKEFWRIVEPGRPLVTGWVLEAICDHLEAVTFGEINRLLINVPPGSTKAASVETPVLTTWGWKAHGDLRPGDFVFGPDGKPKRVLGVTPHRVEPTYEITFDDNVSVIASEGHLWQVERDYPYAAPGGRRMRKTEVVHTPDLIPSIAGRAIQRPDRIPIASPPQMPPKRLLIDPYVLGVWLGDGTAREGGFSVGHEDIEHFSTLGEISNVMAPAGLRKQPFYRVTVEGLRIRLRILGLLENKHIPDDYMEASVEQRWELLRGLMDTDGCATAAGNCTFITKYASLGEQVHSLACSLGLKATRREAWSTLNGKRFGPYQEIRFTPPTGATIFKLRRKQDRLHVSENPRITGRYVKSVTPAGDREVNCITVEGELYLIGRQFVTTHNSMTADVFWPAWEWGPMGLPMTRYMCASYNQHLTARDNRRFRRLIMSSEYQNLWGDQFGPAEDAFNVLLVGNNKTGWKLATSIGGTGVGERADRVIIDDGNNPLESESETVMESTAIWFREVIPDRLNHLEESSIINIQQRTSEADISGIILSEQLGYVHLMIPMEYDPSRHCVTQIGWQDPRGLGDDGEPLSDYEREQRRGLLAWPERFSPEALAKLYRAKGEYAVSGQYQQLPTPRGGGLFKREWIEPWPPLNPDRSYPHDMVDQFNRIRFPALEYVVAWVDTAYTEKQENDFCAMSVVGIFRAEGKGSLVPNGDGTYKRVADDHGYPKAIVLHAWNKRLTIHGPPEEIPPGVTLQEWNSPRYLNERKKTWGLVEWVADTVRRYKVDYLGIETQALGHTLEQELHRLHRDLPCIIETVPARGDKVTRGYAVQGSFSSRQIYFPTYEDGSYPSWLDPLADQLFVFPKGQHDDLVDTLTGAIKHLRETGLFDRREEWDREIEDAMLYRPGQNRVTMPYEI